MSHNVKNYFEVVSKLVEETGELIKKRIWAAKTIETKASAIDFVTETDKEVEDLLINGLKCNFPEHKFIGEETSSETNNALKLTDEPTWIIDPVDGTLNFVHGNPHVCTSIGLYINQKPEIGIIDVPVLGFRFTAIRGEGAFLNGKPIKVSGEKELNNSLIVIEGGSSTAPEKRQVVIENFSSFLPVVHGDVAKSQRVWDAMASYGTEKRASNLLNTGEQLIGKRIGIYFICPVGKIIHERIDFSRVRSYGSAAFNLASVAMGAVDSYFEYGLHIWDMAAGNLIVTEAGGVMMDTAGGPLDLMSCRMVAAASPELGKEIAQKVKQFTPKRDDE